MVILTRAADDPHSIHPPWSYLRTYATVKLYSRSLPLQSFLYKTLPFFGPQRWWCCLLACTDGSLDLSKEILDWCVLWCVWRKEDGLDSLLTNESWYCSCSMHSAVVHNDCYLPQANLQFILQVWKHFGQIPSKIFAVDCFSENHRKRLSVRNYVGY